MKINFDLVESGERVEFNLKDTKVVNTGGGVSEIRVREIVEVATAEVANAKSAVFVDGQKVDEFNADEKFDKTGGAIGGDVSIQGNLSVSGTTTTTDTQTLRVLDNVVVANANGIPLVDLSGFAIKTDAKNAYGIMYDTVGDGVKIGLGGFTEDGKFVYNEGEAQFLATRADALTDGHIPKWDNEKKQFVDSGVGYDEYVKFTNYAAVGKVGVVKAANEAGTGIVINADGLITVYPASKSDIENIFYYPTITSLNVGYATKYALTHPEKYTTVLPDWTDEDKAKACETIGAAPRTNPSSTKPCLWASDGVWRYIQVNNYTAEAWYVPVYMPETIGDANVGGYLLTNTPTRPYHAANKKYVDDIVGGIEAVLDSIIAIQNTLIGGGV